MGLNLVPALNPSGVSDPNLATRAHELFDERRHNLHCSTDRNFAILLVLQWVAALLYTVLVSGRTWSGESSAIHPHVWLALIFGGAVTSLPVALTLFEPGRAITRHVVAASQALMSAILIHITGGRIETHFHVFGSLAFLAFYRDWRVLITASAIVAVDHFMRGLYWPQSVFGVVVASPWRWLEHAGWVVFEDVFLMISIRQNLTEMLGMAERQARLESVIAVREKTEAELAETHKELVEASREAGMAEVATSVLHNVGNVLNSVNTSISVASERVALLKASGLGRIAALVSEHKNDLPAFFMEHPQGTRLPMFLNQLSEHFASEQQTVLRELESLRGNLEHINEIVSMQQNYAGAGGVAETLRLAEVVEDALRMNEASFERHSTHVACELDPALPLLTLDRNKLLLILVNLVRNAKHACEEREGEDRRVTVRAQVNGNGRTRISVIDNGIGIPPENLTRIFEHGFTTRKNGHGFGLHSSALAAAEMGGSLHAQSDGPGAGATFTLELPLSPVLP
jgi:signal transduction histidine kinase